MLQFSFDPTRKGYYLVLRPDGTLVSRHTSRDECYGAITQDGLDGTYTIDCPLREVTVTREVEETPVDPPIEPPTVPEGDILSKLYTTAEFPEWDRAWNRSYELKKTYTDDEIEEWLYEPPATIALQYLRTGREDLRQDFADIYELYLSKFFRNSQGQLMWWTRPYGDARFTPLRQEFLYREIFNSQGISDEWVRDISDASYQRRGSGLPFDSPEKGITERNVAAQLHSQIWAYAILGEQLYKDRAEEMLGYVEAWQDNPGDGIPPDGSLRHSVARHEGNPYPGLDVPRDRGFSPWMSALVGAELYHFDVVFGGDRGKQVAIKLAEAMRLAYEPEFNDRRSAYSGIDGYENDYQVYMAIPYKEGDFTDRELVDWVSYFADLHVPDMAVLYWYGESDLMSVVDHWFASDAYTSSRNISDNVERAWGWQFKNGTPWVTDGE